MNSEPRSRMHTACTRDDHLRRNDRRTSVSESHGNKCVLLPPPFPGIFLFHDLLGRHRDFSEGSGNILDGTDESEHRTEDSDSYDKYVPHDLWNTDPQVGFEGNLDVESARQYELSERACE